MHARARRRSVVAAILLVSAVNTACSPSEPVVITTPGPDVEAIRDARAAFATPVQDLGTAVLAVVAAGRVARLEPAPSDSNGAPNVTTRAFQLDEYEARLGDLDAIAGAEASIDAAVQASEDPYVQAATQQWSRGLREARQVVVGGTAEVTLLRDLLDVEATLAGIASLWDQPGSKREQTERLSTASDEADDVVEALAAMDEMPVCSGSVARRHEAAVLVAERTRTLYQYVRNGQGASFDEARAQYDLEPWHDGIPTDDVDDDDCWQSSSSVAVAGAAVEESLAALVEALNPTTGLTSSEPSEG